MKTKLSFLRSPFSVLLIAVAMVFAGCKSDDEPVKKHSTPYYFGNTDPSAADFYPLRTTPPKSPILLSADSVEVEYVILTAIKTHPLSDGDGGFSYLSPNGVKNYLNNGFKPALEALGAKGKLGGEMDLNAETYDATASERAIMESYGMTFVRVE
jgi:hypothetical protein